MNVTGRPLPRRVVLLVLAVFVVVAVALGASGILRIRAMQREIALIEADLGRLHAQTQTLMVTVERLRNDPLYIEKLAREDLGYVREGETVLKFPSQPR